MGTGPYVEERDEGLSFDFHTLGTLRAPTNCLEWSRPNPQIHLEAIFALLRNLADPLWIA